MQGLEKGYNEVQTLLLEHNSFPSIVWVFRKQQAAGLVTVGHCIEQFTMQPSVHTDLPHHVWRDGNRGPDDRVDTKEYQPEQHASPDGQMTELWRNRERKVNTGHLPSST